MTLRISSELLAQLLKAAENAPDIEVCGLLLGQGDQVTQLCPAANIAPDPARHFELDPATLIGAHRAARDGGLMVIGHWHSHPHGPAYPSQEDARCASPDGQVWIILGQDGVQCWRAVENGTVHGRFEQEALAVV